MDTYNRYRIIYVDKYGDRYGGYRYIPKYTKLSNMYNRYDYSCKHVRFDLSVDYTESTSESTSESNSNYKYNSNLEHNQHQYNNFDDISTEYSCDCDCEPIFYTKSTQTKLIKAKHPNEKLQLDSNKKQNKHYKAFHNRIQNILNTNVSNERDCLNRPKKITPQQKIDALELECLNLKEIIDKSQ